MVGSAKHQRAQARREALLDHDHAERVRFSNAQRGKFFRKDAVLELPIYLDPTSATISPRAPRTRASRSTSS